MNNSKSLFGAQPSMKGKVLQVSPNGRYFVDQDGKPFFYLADTAWTIFKRLMREEVEIYLQNRLQKGFNVIQAYFLRGLNMKNAYGHVPLIDKDPAKPNEAFFENVDYVVNRANESGIVIGGVVTWGVHVQADYGVNRFPEEQVFNADNAYIFGKFLGSRYKDNCVIWYLGGDKEPMEHADVWASMARGLKDGSVNRHLVSYHGPGITSHVPSSSVWFYNEKWLDFNALQTGHRWSVNSYEYITHDYELIPVKPVLDMEAGYENHIDVSRTVNRRIDARQVRESVYWQVLAGAAGFGYGCNDIWGFWEENMPDDKKDYSHPGNYMQNTHWQAAMDFDGAKCLGLARKLFEIYPWYKYVPDLSVISRGQGEGADHIQAARAMDGSFILAYLPKGNPVGIHMDKLAGSKVKAQWYNPRDGRFMYIGLYENRGEVMFIPPTNYDRDDWVLVLESLNKLYRHSKMV